jgi:predicted nucleic acid-binding protein
MWRIYLDVCCLNRPFDDQTQERIRLEAEAVLLVLGHLRAGDWRWLTSEAVSTEIDRAPDTGRRARLRMLTGDAHEVVSIGAAEAERARELLALGFRALDALHLSCAESGGAEVFLTTDDRLLRLAARVAGDLRVRVANPLVWLGEITRP